MIRRLAPVVLAAVLLIPLLPAPAVRAAEYQMQTMANYLVDPAAGAITVSVAVTFTNTLPDPPGQVSAFTHVDLAIHDGASQVAAADADGALHVDVEAQDGVRVASVRTRARVRYNRSVSFTLTYQLADAATPDVHVRPRVVKFPVWGFGTTSDVTVRLPAGFEVRVDGDPMVMDEDAEGARLTSGPIPDPGRWLALVTATLPAEYVTRSASVPLTSGTVDLQVRSWSDDVAWGERTLAVLEEALPMLEDAIGLPYPRLGPLVVSEAAGDDDRGGVLSPVAEIQVAFDGTTFTLLHQVAHVWIDDHLAADRWIREGLASHYAASVAPQLQAIPPYDPAARAEELAADARPLVEWATGPGIAATDAYGYAASWVLTDRIADSVGDASLSMALARVVAGASAYDEVEPGGVEADGRPYAPVDTRRLLDQLAAVSGSDLSDLFAEMAFGPDDESELAQRTAARDAYHQLIGAAGGWGAPEPVRAAMADWAFDDAEALIDEATAWLLRRDALVAACDDAGLVPPDRLRDRYLVDGGGTEASAELDAEQALVSAYVAMQVRAAAPRAPLDTVGLFLATEPEALLADAAESFGSGDLGGAADSLDRLELELNRAPSDGVVRLAGVVAVIAVLGLGTGVALRRRASTHYTAAR